MAPSAYTNKTWSRDGFVISTDPTLVPLSALNAAFDSDYMGWARSLSEDALRQMLDNSLNFGIYSPTGTLPPQSAMEASESFQTTHSDTLHEIAERVHLRPPPAARSESAMSTSPALIGFARLITDFVTFAYLTDVYILPDWREQGLGSWLISCVRETLDGMPDLRRSMLITSVNGPNVKYYEKRLGMGPVEDMYTVMSVRGKGSGHYRP